MVKFRSGILACNSGNIPNSDCERVGYIYILYLCQQNITLLLIQSIKVNLNLFSCATVPSPVNWNTHPCKLEQPMF